MSQDRQAALERSTTMLRVRLTRSDLLTLCYAAWQAVDSQANPAGGYVAMAKQARLVVSRLVADLPLREREALLGRHGGLKDFLGA